MEKTHQAAGHSRGQRPTCDRGKNLTEDTEQQVCLDQCVFRDGCYKASLARTRAHLAPRVEDDRVQQDGAAV